MDGVRRAPLSVQASAHGKRRKAGAMTTPAFLRSDGGCEVCYCSIQTSS